MYGFEARTVIEDDRIGVEQISLIRAWLETENLSLTDEQIVLFSLACLNRFEETKSTIKSYCSIRGTCPALFTDRRAHLAELQRQLNVVDFAIFPRRTVDGCAIVCHRLRDDDFRRYDMEVAMKLLFMTLDAALYDYPPTGLIVLFDMKGVGLLHLTRVKMRLVKVFFKYVQECLPVRLRKIHVLNSVYFLEKVMGIIRPFAKAEVMELVRFHPTDLDMGEFHRQILPELLPADYKGQLEPMDVLANRTARRLLELEAFFEADASRFELHMSPSRKT